jgi:hypothetical protein
MSIEDTSKLCSTSDKGVVDDEPCPAVLYSGCGLMAVRHLSQIGCLAVLEPEESVLKTVPGCPMILELMYDTKFCDSTVTWSDLLFRRSSAETLS